MVEERTLHRRLTRLRESRLDALRAQARAQAAADILAEQGSVSVDEIDTRVTATFAEPSDQHLANLMARKTAAAVEFETRELERLREARDRAEERIAKVQAALAGAEQAVEALDEQIADAQTRIDEARELAELAAPDGDPAVVLTGQTVTVHAEVAQTSVDAAGTDDEEG